jgi:hypothetical protein
VAEALMRGFRSTLILLAVFLGLLGYVYFVQSKKPAAGESAGAKPRVFSIEADKVEGLQITLASGETTTLRRTPAGWTISAPADTAADQTEASNIATALAGLEQQRIVEENAATLADYGLAEPRIDVGFKLAGEADLRHLLVGDKTATGGDLYAKLPSEKRVFLIQSYLDGTFNRTLFDLRDKTVLKFDRDKVDTFEAATKDGTVRLAKSGAEWKLVKPLEAPADLGIVESLISQIQSSQMLAILEPDAGNLAKYGLDRPEVTVTLAAGSARAALLVGAGSPDGAAYARDVSRPIVFTIPSALASELRKSAFDYRRKDIFEFRPFNANRFEITRAGQVVAFERVKGAGENPQDTWKQVAPASKTVDASRLEGALLQVANLRAEAFVDTPAPIAALKAPAATIVVRFDDGKREERVAIARVGSDVFAGRADQPGAARLESGRFDEALKALDELK